MIEQGQALAGKNIAIFGGTSGLGEALVDVLKGKGANVIALSRRIAGQGNSSNLIACDVKDEDSVKKAFGIIDKTFDNQLDIVINCVGMGLMQKPEDNSENNLLEIMGTNFNGTVHTSQEALERMLRRGKGLIINVSSTSGRTPRANETLYAASKAAVDQYTLSLRESALPRGVQVSLVVPGGMRSENFWNQADPTRVISNFLEPKYVAQRIVDEVILTETPQAELIIRRQ